VIAEGNYGAPVSLSGGSVEGSLTARDGALATLQSSLNTLAWQVISQVNTVYSKGYDLNGNTGQNFFTGSTAADIGVNSTLVNDPSTFQAAGVAGAPGDNTVVSALAQLANQSNSALNNQTLTQNYAETVSTLGSSLQSVNDQLDNSTSVSQMLASQRASTSGVDTDTEMTNLMQFQKAYQASAELITTINEMMETVVNMKTE
jgi:flagellar hook-associated protein 1 FlgK